MKRKYGHINKTLLEHYQTNEFNYWGYSVVLKGFSDLERDFIYTIPELEQKTVLDMGCGGGRIAKAIASIGVKKLVGADFSYKFCQTFNHACDSFRNNAGAVNSEITEQPFRQNTFDIIFYWGNILSCLDNPLFQEQALREGYRILKPGGKLFLTVLNFHGRLINYPLFWFISCLRTFKRHPIRGRNLPWLKKNNRINKTFFKLTEPQFYWFTKKEIRKMAINIGFTVKELKTGRDTIIGPSICAEFSK